MKLVRSERNTGSTSAVRAAGRGVGLPRDRQHSPAIYVRITRSLRCDVRSNTMCRLIHIPPTATPARTTERKIDTTRQLNSRRRRAREGVKLNRRRRTAVGEQGAGAGKDRDESVPAARAGAESRA
ncbi:hypothetical protein EVAR_27819_1 [Eumeta japonica]|uniref:Uncharacterized protein n=1 Tax=Eumeta variegata TaxID=151549 RepID=A0A4C1VJ71_EUMVA|nr:hypothetical protein EVAR_27819_1 [Eumeta japonica]